MNPIALFIKYGIWAILIIVIVLFMLVGLNMPTAGIAGGGISGGNQPTSGLMDTGRPTIPNCGQECLAYSKVYPNGQMVSDNTACRNLYYTSCGGGITFQPTGAFYMLSDNCCCWTCDGGSR